MDSRPGKIFLLVDKKIGKPFFVLSWVEGEPDVSEQIRRLRILVPVDELPAVIEAREVSGFTSIEDRGYNVWSIRKLYPGLSERMDQIERWKQNPNRRQILLAVIRQAGKCKFANSELAKRTGISVAQVKRYLKEFKESGIITVQTSKPSPVYFEGKKTWVNERTINVIHAISEAEVSQQGNPDEGSAAAG